MKDFIIRYWVEALFGGIIAISMGLIRTFRISIFSKRSSRANCQHAIELGVQSLLRGEIIKLHSEHTTNEFCPIHIKDSVASMYTAYKGLGGNGTVTKMAKEIENLPVEKEE